MAMNLASRYFRSRLDTYLLFACMEDYYRIDNQTQQSLIKQPYNNGTHQLLLHMHNKENISSSTASSFTEHLQKTHQQEIQLLNNFRYRFPKQAEQPLSSTVKLQRSKKTIDQQQQIGLRQEDAGNLRIDSSALVVKGKLVYLQEEKEDISSDKKKLMRLLKENNINYKDYLLGNKQKCLESICANQQQKKQRVVNDYIKRYINMEKNTKIQTAPNYDTIKQQLFLFK